MKPTVIIVDDLAPLRREVRGLLEAEFSILGEAANGREAVDLVARVQPQLAVMDIVMPVSSGLDALAAIRKLPPPRPQVVILSALTDAVTITRALELGASEYLFKPVDEKKLLTILKKLIPKSLKA